MAYHLLRASLSLRRKPPLLEMAIAPTDEQPSRSDFLRDTFSRRHDFMHRGTEYTYVFLGEDDGVLAARLGKTANVLEPQGPETGYEPAERRRHMAVNVFFDIRERQQILAIQGSNFVGRPSAIAGSLIRYLNDSDLDAPFVIDLGTINDPSSFWDVARRYEGQITNITFHFFAPNVLGLSGEIPDGMKRVRDRLNGRSATLSFNNPEGLQLETDEIRGGVTYAVRGGGDVSLRRGKESVYSSREKIKKVKIQYDEEVSSNFRGFLRRIREDLFG